MKRAWTLAAPALAACLLIQAGCRGEGRPSSPVYDSIKWGVPKPISERVGGPQYALPDGWKNAVGGVARIRVSNSGALRYDPATVANARRFKELTGIEVELLPWSEGPVSERTVAIFCARSDAVDVLTYDHLSDYVELVGGGWLVPLDTLWNDPNVWKLYSASLQKGLTARDGRIYGTVGRVGTQMLYYRPSLVAAVPRTWQEVRAAARRAVRPDFAGLTFAAGESDALDTFRAIVYSQGGRLVDAKRQRLVVTTPEGRNAWKLLADLVVADGSAPRSVVGASWMEAADAFALGRAAMVLGRAVDIDRFKDPQRAPGLRGDYAAAPPPKWDTAQPDANMAASLGFEGYVVNRFVNDRQKAAAMLFVDYMRSFEATSRELLDEGNEAAFLPVYDSAPARELPAAAIRKTALANAVLEPLPPARGALGLLMQAYFSRVVDGSFEPTRALDELQTRLDEYAVP
jgi:ABC-type glycerol-3-phosphate transport system substrate-binding protein